MIQLLRLCFVAVMIGLWWLASLYVERGLVPSPAATVRAAVRLSEEGRLWKALGASLSVYLSGLAAATFVGIPIGAVMGAVRILGQTLDVFVYALAATPRVAFIPLIIVFLGLGFEAKSFIVFLGAVMPIIINTYTGVLNADEELIEMARSTGATKNTILRQIILPGAMPFLVAGLRLGATIGLINTVVAELYTSVQGLGGLLAVYGNTFRMAEYFVIVLMLALLGGLVNEGLRLIERRMMRWRGVR